MNHVTTFLNNKTYNKMNLSYTLPHAEENIKAGIKIHTLRDDPKNRWGEGYTIHHCYSFRSANGYKCFLKNECTGTQKVILELRANKYLAIKVDEKYITQEKGEDFITNDGFERMEDFINWFFPLNKKGQRTKTEWKGKIIHWTSLRY